MNNPVRNLYRKMPINTLSILEILTDESGVPIDVQSVGLEEFL